MEQIEQQMREVIGDPAIRIVPLRLTTEQRQQIVCREQDEALVEMLALRWMPRDVRFEIISL